MDPINIELIATILLTVVFVSILLYFSPWAKAPVWYPSPHDKVSMKDANNAYQHWITSVLSWAGTGVWENPAARAVLLKRPGYLGRTVNFQDEECGVLQTKVDKWIAELSATGVVIPDEILSNKPDFGVYAPIRHQRVAGQRYWSDSPIGSLLTVYGDHTIVGVFLTTVIGSSAYLSYYLVYGQIPSLFAILVSST